MTNRQTSDLPLKGKGIVVTRPVRQAENLTRRIARAGGTPVLFPAVEIQPGGDALRLAALIDRLDAFDWAIFISPSAAEQAMNRINARRRLPPTLRVAALGGGSARALARFGIQAVVSPVGKFDSEALLELPEMQEMSGQRVIVFRGEGGREWLADALTHRGAQVEFADCYRRGKPDADAAPLLRRWARNEVHAITATSSEILRNLFDLVGVLGQQWLKKTPVFVIHERIAHVARELGISHVIITTGGDDGLVAGMIDWFNMRGGHE